MPFSAFDKAFLDKNPAHSLLLLPLISVLVSQIQFTPILHTFLQSPLAVLPSFWVFCSPNKAASYTPTEKATSSLKIVPNCAYRSVERRSEGIPKRSFLKSLLNCQGARGGIGVLIMAIFSLSLGVFVIGVLHPILHFQSVCISVCTLYFNKIST